MYRIFAGFLLAASLLSAQQAANFEESVRSAMAGSLEKQRISIRKQASAGQTLVASADAAAGNSSFYSVPWPIPPQWKEASGTAAGDCDPMPKQDLDKLVKAASEKEGLKEELIQAVIGKESAARPCALSPKGAQGLMQLMPATAAELGVADPFDPQQNVEGGSHLLKQLLTKYNGDVALALGAYNAGSGRVDRAGGVPAIPETLNYVSDILNRFRVQ